MNIDKITNVNNVLSVLMPQGERYSPACLSEFFMIKSKCRTYSVTGTVWFGEKRKYHYFSFYYEGNPYYVDLNIDNEFTIRNSSIEKILS